MRSRRRARASEETGPSGRRVAVLTWGTKAGTRHQREVLAPQRRGREQADLARHLVDDTHLRVDRRGWIFAAVGAVLGAGDDLARLLAGIGVDLDPRGATAGPAGDP